MNEDLLELFTTTKDKTSNLSNHDYNLPRENTSPSAQRAVPRNPPTFEMEPQSGSTRPIQETPTAMFDPTLLAFADLSLPGVSQPWPASDENDTRFARNSSRSEGVGKSHRTKRIKVDSGSPDLDSTGLVTGYDRDQVGYSGGYDSEDQRTSLSSPVKHDAPTRPDQGNRSWSAVNPLNPHSATDFCRHAIMPPTVSVSPNLSSTYRSSSLDTAMKLGRTPDSLVPLPGFDWDSEISLDSEHSQGFEDISNPKNMSQATTSDHQTRSKQDCKRNTRSKHSTPRRTQRSPLTKSCTHAKIGMDESKSITKISHNDVERKYRTNLKDKIAELREAIPALNGTIDLESKETIHSNSRKVSKGTVLSKATEYIHHLEHRNETLILEQQQLEERLQLLETLFNSASRQGNVYSRDIVSIFNPASMC